MVLQKRSVYGFSGYQVPAMPHFPKAVKRKRSIRRKVEDNQMCPFDLLVTVAGKLLSEREDSALSPRCINGTSNATNTDEAPVKQEQACKKEPSFDQQSCDDASVLGPEIVIKKQISCGLKEHSQVLRPKDSVVKSEISDAIAGESKILNNGVEISSGRNPPAFAKVQGDGLESEHQMPENGLELNALHTYSSGDPIDLDVKPPALVSSDSSIEIPVCRNNLSRSSSLPKHESAMELVVDGDDDDNSSGCTHPSTITHKTCRPQLVGDRGVRKLSALKYWKATPNMFKYGGVSHYDTETKLGLHGKKTCYTRHRTQRRSFFKRRKLFERCSVSASNGGFLGEDISNLWEKGGINIEVCDPHKTCLEANSAPTSKRGQNSSYDSVKLSIKCFKVPELFIEIPETATVGSLKRTVMEAVTAILEGGLRVGVLFQGKKVRDDNKTLRQAGISQCAKLDNLGFTLDPSPTKTPPPHFLCLGDAVVVEPPLAARIPPGLALPDVSPQPQPQPQPVLASSGPQSDHDSVHSPTDDVSSLDQTTTTTRAANRLALVALPPMSVPLRKPRRRPEHVQRRIRRPFSVAEVEALVQAVEKLGTGRWRDVKLGAFGNAKHRTYVDLKDKWKTLVHTARISPRQRRGEAVPQELLDRVLSAQAYRSQQQAKLHLKPAHLMIHRNTRVEKDDC